LNTESGLSREKGKNNSETQQVRLELTLLQLRHVLRHVQDQLQPWPIYGQPKDSCQINLFGRKMEIENFPTMKRRKKVELEIFRKRHENKQQDEAQHAG
jgi:hypothetical protein